MAVVGVDIGDYNTFISVARQGGVETIANEYSQRNTPSIVALGDKQRFMGVSAENQRNINVKNTVSFFKNFLGRSFKDPYVQKQLGNVGAEVVELTDGKIGFILGEKTFVPEQILGMMLTKAFGSWRLPLTLPLQKWKRNLRKVVLIQKRLLRLRRVFVSSSCKENVGLVIGVEMCMKEAPQLH